jgi:hypothetical protein
MQRDWDTGDHEIYRKISTGGSISGKSTLIGVYKNYPGRKSQSLRIKNFLGK